MVKETPSFGRLLAMAAFTLSCFGIVLFLWIAFGGSIPLRPEGYRMQIAFPEATTLAKEADVRIAGVNVGKVKDKRLDKGGARTIVELELQEPYAPVPRDTRAVLRQKTLLGETYVELAPGKRGSKMLPDGGRLANAYVRPTVELDEIFEAFDKPTRTAFQQWTGELSKAIANGRGQDLNDALGNLEGFAVDGSKLLSELDQQEVAVRRLIKNTGVVFGAVNEREGALRRVVENSSELFRATASRDRALAETVRVFPTFLDESRTTLARVQRFSTDTRPLVNKLKGPADDLAPTVRDLGDLAPDLEALFRDLGPLIDASVKGVPDLERTLRGAEPLVVAAHQFLPELNPILSLLNYHQATVAGFFSNAAADLNSKPGGERVQTQIAIIDPRSLSRLSQRPAYERGNAYLEPNALLRGVKLGVFESFDCKPSGGEVRDPIDDAANKAPPCLVAPDSLYSGKKFNRSERGVAPNKSAPQGLQGSEPARP